MAQVSINHTLFMRYVDVQWQQHWRLGATKTFVEQIF